MIQSLAPFDQRCKQEWQVNLAKTSCGLSQILDRTLEHGSHADAIARRIVMESYRNLHHSLQKLLIFWWRSTPNVLKLFVGCKKLGVVEQADAVVILI